MTQQFLFGILLLMAGCFLETSSRPSNNEMEINYEATEIADTNEAQEEERSYPNKHYFTEEVYDDGTRQIMEKIKAINNKLKKPNAAHKGSYVLNKDDVDVIQQNLENIQQLMDFGKLNGYYDSNKGQNNVLNNNDYLETRLEYARALQYLQPTITNNALPQIPAAFPSTSMAYMTSIPVLVVPSGNGVYDGYQNNDVNPMQYAMYQTKQRPPSLPFNIPWPLAPFFPILIKDPLISYLTSGGFNNLVEYGQNADVCNRKQKSHEDAMKQNIEINDDDDPENEMSFKLVKLPNSREGRAKGKAIKKRTVSKSVPLQQIDDVKKLQNFFQPKPSVTTPKPTIKPVEIKTKTKDDEGDLRMPFGDFTWFGNRKPVAPSPGFFINRLKVRRGGVAIAGPGGVATAGKSGTAVVGPGGLAYTQPGGVAVAGPGARVVALTSDADMSSVVSRLQKQSATDGSIPRLFNAIRGGGDYRRSFDQGRAFGNTRDPEENQYTGSKFLKNEQIENPDFVLYLNPIAHAVNLKGVAIANPVSEVVIAKGKTAKIVFDPVATAVVGPGGIAHAQSDLIVYEYVRE